MEGSKQPSIRDYLDKLREDQEKQEQTQENTKEASGNEGEKQPTTGEEREMKHSRKEAKERNKEDKNTVTGNTQEESKEWQTPKKDTENQAERSKKPPKKEKGKEVRERKNKRGATGRAIFHFRKTTKKRRITEDRSIEVPPENTTWKDARKTYDGVKYKPKGKRPEGIQHEDTKITAIKDIRIRLKILALNVRSILANKKC